MILAHENKIPLDDIIFSEVMFDKKNGISGENFRHMEFVKNKAKPLFEKWGYKVHILHSERDYLDVFYRTIEHPRKHMEHKGMLYGFPISGRCSVKRDCKMKPITDFYKAIGEDYIDYLGIAIDEPKRLESMHKDTHKVSLLEQYGYTEQAAKELCKKYDLLSPCYEISKRSGCWMCPNSKICESREVKEKYPDAWKKFVSLEKEINVAQPKWNVFGDTLEEIDKKLSIKKNKQLTIYDCFSFIDKRE